MNATQLDSGFSSREKPEKHLGSLEELVVSRGKTRSVTTDCSRAEKYKREWTFLSGK